VSLPKAFRKVSNFEQGETTNWRNVKYKARRNIRNGRVWLWVEEHKKWWEVPYNSPSSYNFKKTI